MWDQVPEFRYYQPAKEETGEGHLQEGLSPREQDAGNDHVEHEVEGHGVLDAAGEVDQQREGEEVRDDLTVCKQPRRSETASLRPCLAQFERDDEERVVHGDGRADEVEGHGIQT